MYVKYQYRFKKNQIQLLANDELSIPFRIFVRKVFQLVEVLHSDQDNYTISSRWDLFENIWYVGVYTKIYNGSIFNAALFVQHASTTIVIDIVILFTVNVYCFIAALKCTIRDNKNFQQSAKHVYQPWVVQNIRISNLRNQECMRTQPWSRLTLGEWRHQSTATHCGRDKMAINLQTTLQSHFRLGDIPFFVQIKWRSVMAGMIMLHVTLTDLQCIW